MLQISDALAASPSPSSSPAPSEADAAPVSAPTTPSTYSAGASGGSGSNTGAIVGGVVGGIGGAALIVFLVLRHRRDKAVVADAPRARTSTHDATATGGSVKWCKCQLWERSSVHPPA